MFDVSEEDEMDGLVHSIGSMGVMVGVERQPI
jgi:hypothetical protein